jgi:transposase
MRFYVGKHKHYCGIDLHTRSMYVCVVDRDAKVLFHKNLPAEPAALLAALRPFRDGLVIAAECMHCWYWLADLCADEEIPFVLGHALFMKAIHGAKAKNDRIDSEKIAQLLRSGLLPQAYVYPRDMRSTRDLLRRRSYLVRQRTELLSHLQTVNNQHNLPALQKRITSEANRTAILDRFAGEPQLAAAVAADCAIIDALEAQVRRLELHLERCAKVQDAQAFYLLRSLPGVGKILALTILYEIHSIDRFPTVGDFASYARLVKCAHTSAGKMSGYGGSKMGNPHLKWAFSEAAVLFLRANPRAQQLLARLEKKHGKAKALSILAHRLGRVTYQMLKRKQPFDADRLYAAA